MKDVMGLINDTTIKQHLKEIAYYRSIAAVPFGGRYRLIDFPLSNMTNAGIKNVGIFTKNNNRSLLEHVGAGSEWDLPSKRDGLFILPPAFGSNGNERPVGDLDYFYSHFDYLRRSRQEYIVLTNSNNVYNVNYVDMVGNHKASGADITLLYQEENAPVASLRFTMVQVDREDCIVDMAVKKERPISNKLSMETYVMKKALFMEIVDAAIAKGYSDFVKDGLIRNIGQLKMKGYRYEGFWAKIDSVNSYYRNHMALLNPHVWRDLFLRDNRIHTKAKDEAPAKYMEGAQVQNALIANGCVVEGTVENSILFRGVKIREGAVVKNSILMQKCEVGEGAVIENVILDKDVKISKGRQLKGDRNYPMVIEKRALV